MEHKVYIVGSVQHRRHVNSLSLTICTFQFLCNATDSRLIFLLVTEKEKTTKTVTGRCQPLFNVGLSFANSGLS